MGVLSSLLIVLVHPMWEGDYWHSCVGVVQWCSGIWPEFISRLLKNCIDNICECVETGYEVDWKGREEIANNVKWRMKDEVHFNLF